MYRRSGTTRSLQAKMKWRTILLGLDYVLNDAPPKTINLEKIVRGLIFV